MKALTTSLLSACNHVLSDRALHSLRRLECWIGGSTATSKCRRGYTIKLSFINPDLKLIALTFNCQYEFGKIAIGFVTRISGYKWAEYAFIDEGQWPRHNISLKTMVNCCAVKDSNHKLFEVVKDRYTGNIGQIGPRKQIKDMFFANLKTRFKRQLTT